MNVLLIGLQIAKAKTSPGVIEGYCRNAEQNNGREFRKIRYNSMYIEIK
jgi:hypothetical protein